MSCYSPLKAWTIGMTKNGKRKLMVTSYKVDHLEQLPDGSYLRSMEVLDSTKEPGANWTTAFETIPCGTCTGCRLERSKQWANRCLLEMQYHESSYFVTLTYDDIHVPCDDGVFPDTGEIVQTHSLVLSDLQKFFKRLRKVYPEKIRYFACGEYGDRTARPHYHAIIFGLKLNDLVPYKRSGDYWYYNSKFIQDLWPYGYAVVGEASRETAAYVARYCTKKLYGDESKTYDWLNLKPPFIVMSRKPGIGLEYLNDHPEVFDNAYIYQGTERGAVQFRPPKYFKRKYDEWFENDFDYCKMRDEEKNKSKEQMEIVKKLKLSQTDMSYLDLLASEEVVLKSKLKKLERSL